MSKITQRRGLKQPCKSTTKQRNDDCKTFHNTSLEEFLANQGFFVGIPTGNSMWPMLRSKKDQFVIITITEELEIGDVALFRQMDKLILHRVINRDKDAYTLKGDNCMSCELVSHQEIIGKLQGFYRGNSYFDCTLSNTYKFYCKTLKLHYLTNKIIQSAKSNLRRLQKSRECN